MMIRSSIRNRLLAGSGVIAVALGLAQHAAAQNSDGIQLQEVVVTARKRVERLQDTPASIAVVGAQELVSKGAVRFQDYASLVPGLSLTSSRTGAAQVTLRGITTGPAQSASATAFYIDEAPIGSVNAYTTGSSTTPDLDPADLSRIEVLKGPQGTLYGAGSVGGLVKFVTEDPNYSDFSGRISAGVSTVKSGETAGSVRGLVNVPLITDRLTLRVSAFQRNDPGYIDNVAGSGSTDVNSVRVEGGRISLAAKLNDNAQVILSGLAQDTHSDGGNAMDVDLATLKPLYGDLKARRFTAEPSAVALRLYNIKATGSVGAVKLLSSTTYQTVKSKVQGDGSASYGVLLGALLRVPNLGIRTLQTTKTERWSQEFRADTTTLDGALDLQGGLYFTHENDANRVPGFIPFSTATGATLTLPTIIAASITTRYTEYSAYANATYHFTDKFDVLAGYRYAYDKQNYLQDYSGLLVGARRVNIASDSDNVSTFLVSPRYKFDDHHMAYARVASGYRPGGPNAVPPPSVAVAPDSFQPDTLTSYEVGYKADFLDRTVSVDAALFYTDWKDIQIQTSAGGFNFFVNGGTAVSKGGELTLRWTPVRNLVLGLNSAYTNARLTSAAPAAGGVSGDRLPFVPHVSGSLTADYHWPVADNLDATVGVAINHMSGRIADYSTRYPQSLPSTTTVNLTAGLEHGNWRLTGFARNVTDERVITSLSTRGLAPGPTNPYSAGVTTPRTFGAELAVKF